MKAVYKEPGKAPEIIDAGNSLEVLQFLVHGYKDAGADDDAAAIITGLFMGQIMEPGE